MAKGQVLKSRLSAPGVIDWPGIRAAALVIGVREAARRASEYLPPNEQRRFLTRVLKRSSREKWLQARATERPPSANPGQATQVITGAEMLENVLHEESRKTREALAVAARRGSEYLRDLKQPAGIVKRHHALRNITAAASDVHGWAEKGSTGGPQLNVLNIQVDARSLTVNRSGNSSGDV